MGRGDTFLAELVSWRHSMKILVNLIKAAWWVFILVIVWKFATGGTLEI